MALRIHNHHPPQRRANHCPDDNVERDVGGHYRDIGVEDIAHEVAAPCR